MSRPTRCGHRAPGGCGRRAPGGCGHRAPGGCGRRAPGGCGGSPGFSLVEVLVALVILSIGLLGLAKIQALAFASTGTASLRSLAALEASSMATAMRTGRNYWSAPPANLTITTSGTTITASDATLGIIANCLYSSNATACTPAQMAAYDLQQWVNWLNTGLLPNPTASISCPTPAVAGSPVGCSIQITWTERNVAVNAQAASANAAASAAGTSAMAAPTYTLYVEP